MRTYLIADTHFNHGKIKTYCQRPEDFTERLIKCWHRAVKPTDLIIHLGDVFIGKVEGWLDIYPQLPGRKVLVRGNHDDGKGCQWWMEHGFDFCCDAMVFRNAFLTHRPADSLPKDCNINIHGHLHNVWDGFMPPNEGVDFYPQFDWQRLFAVEYTNYMPVEFERFVSHPDRFKAIKLTK